MEHRQNKWPQGIDQHDQDPQIIGVFQVQTVNKVLLRELLAAVETIEIIRGAQI